MRAAARRSAPSVRFLASGDWQLGMTRHFLDPDAQARYTSARIDAIRTLADVVVAHDCEFVVVCGDVFETNAVGTRVISRALEAMAAVPVPVYLLPGNHDPLNAASVYRSTHFLAGVPANVHVLARAGLLPVRPGVELVVAPWTSKRPTFDLLGAVLAELTPAPDVVRIGVGHGAVDRLDPDRTDPATMSLQTIEQAIADGRLSIQVLGDRHSATEVGRTGRIWYPGTPEATDYDEIDPGAVLVVEAKPGPEPGNVRVERVRVGTWAFHDLVVRLESAADVAALDEQLLSLPLRDRSVVRLTLTGTLSVPEKAALDAMLDRQRNVLAGLEIWEKKSDLVVLADPAELTDLGIGGFVERAVLDLAEQAAGHSDRGQAARDALGLLYRLAAST